MIEKFKTFREQVLGDDLLISRSGNFGSSLNIQSQTVSSLLRSPRRTHVMCE